MDKFMIVYKLFKSLPNLLCSFNYCAIIPRDFDDYNEFEEEMCALDSDFIAQTARLYVKDHPEVSFRDLWFCREVYELETDANQHSEYKLQEVIYNKVAGYGKV